MIPTKHYKAVTTQTPLLNLLADGPYMDKAYIRTIHPQWKGESVPEIVEKYDHNPFVLRIGTPSTDASMINDRVFFISKYLAYNPTSKEIESRNLIEGRFIKKVYIGEQTVDEASHKDYKLFVNGKVVASDVLFLHTKESLVDKIRSLEQQMRHMQAEIAKIARQTNTQTIYSSNELIK
jgi:hypothetical protein